LDAVDEGIREVVGKDAEAVAGEAVAGVKRLLTLRADRSIGWEDDKRWDEMMELAASVLPASGSSSGET
jgi:hypothetical protein